MHAHTRVPEVQKKSRRLILNFQTIYGVLKTIRLFKHLKDYGKYAKTLLFWKFKLLCMVPTLS